MPARHPLSVQRGFSLLELLVVLVILAIMAATAMISVGTLGGDDELQRESLRLEALMRLAGEEALMQGRDLGLYIEEDRYRFMLYSRDEQRWLPMDADRSFRERELPEGLFFSLSVEDQEVVLEAAGNDAEIEPQVAILSSGELTPFLLYLGREFGDTQFELAGQLDGRLQIREFGPDDF